AVSLPVSISLSCYTCIPVLLFFFFTDTATTEIYTLSLHDALPISIDVFNYGHHRRDFTYIDDIVEGVIRTTDHVATANSDWTGVKPDPGTSKAPYRIYNIGSNNPVELLRYIEILENCLGKKAEKNLLPIQPGDVPDTYADVDALIEDVDYKPTTPVEVGIEHFVKWYRDF